MEICWGCDKAFPMSKLRKQRKGCAKECTKQSEDDTYLDDDLQV